MPWIACGWAIRMIASQELAPMIPYEHIIWLEGSIGCIHTPLSRAAMVGSVDLGGPSVTLVIGQISQSCIHKMCRGWVNILVAYFNKAIKSPPIIVGVVGLRYSHCCRYWQLRPVTTSAVKLGNPHPGMVNILPLVTCPVIRWSWMLPEGSGARGERSTSSMVYIMGINSK